MSSSFSPRSFEPRSVSAPELRLPSQIEYRQVGYCHARSSHCTPRGKVELETMEGTYTEKRGESSQWSVMSMVSCALPGQLQGLGQMAASRMTPKTEAPEQPPPPPADNQDADNTVSAALVQLGVSDQGTLDLPFSKRKAFLSLVTSLAAGMRSPFANSDADWKNGSRGLDQKPGSNRGSDTPRDSHADSERLSYINGALHVLRGLPRDLEPHEAAMLQRAMPSTLAAAPSGVNGQAPRLASGRRNWIHVVVLFFLCWFSASASWIMPKVAVYGKKVIRAEHEHGYIPRLMMAAARLLQCFVEALRWFAECWPCRLLLVMYEYAMRGVRGAVFEFVELSIARDMAVAKGDGAANGGCD